MPTQAQRISAAEAALEGARQVLQEVCTDFAKGPLQERDTAITVATINEEIRGLKALLGDLKRNPDA
jgi:hypothetical protein